MRGIISLGIISMVFCGAVWLAGTMLRTKGCHPPITRATNNARQLVALLFEFDQDHGSFPSPATAADPTLFPTPPPSATANDLLGQLIRAKYTASEEIFYAPNPSLPPKKPDNIISPASRILEPGECGFSYICGLTTSDDPNTPLLLAPMVPGTTTFDREAFDSKVLILCIGQTIRQFKIDPSGHVIIDGKDLFDPAQPFWHGKKPDLRHPAR